MEAERAKDAAEARTAEVSQQLEERTAELQALKGSKPGGAKPTLLEEKLRNYRSPLQTGSLDGKPQRPPGR